MTGGLPEFSGAQLDLRYRLIIQFDLVING